ncbi:MAG TPA: phosphoenolpyruvate synthase, partial [Puia sp.]|nr:phosphoenolpyruvate synthase [Puia sp.]
MSAYILGLGEIDKSTHALVGGKAASLGELSHIKDIQVPDGFCVTTEVYKESIGNNPAVNALLDELIVLEADNRKAISETSAKIRKLIREIAIPQNILEEIIRFLSHLDEQYAFAVRSSATAEDLPTASFAGQQDTYLNIIGREAILKNISQCWASLFTERAVFYRIQNGFDHRKVLISVIVQKMIFPQAAGILFTADPVTSNRKIVSIDAGFGLGEAMVSGLVNADIYKVSDGGVIERKIATKKLAIHALKEGGTMEKEIGPEKQNRQVLTDEQILHLADTGRKIEAHFGYPQDIEWCLADDHFYIVQSRPITTLFPIPDSNDKENHVYISVGHQQMMTDAMKPLGLSVWLLTTAATMRTAAGRLFVDVTTMLASAAGRETLINVLGKSDPLIKDALTNIIEREDFIKMLPDDKKESAAGNNKSAATPRDYQTLVDYDPAIVSDLIRKSQLSIKTSKQNIRTKSGTDLFDFILEDISQLKKIMSDPQSFGVIMTGMNASAWINEKMNEWLGEKNAADTLAQSASNNITSEMGLALLDVADIIRPYPEVIKYLQQIKDDQFLNEIDQLEGGRETRNAINDYLDKYGMRCAGEIDITKTRWSEKPATLVPLILSNIKNFKPGAGHRKFEEGLKEALKKEQELIERLKKLPDGEQKASETKRMIGLIRSFSGYREYPKYGIINHYFIYKQAMLKEAAQLVQAKLIHEKEDIYY